MRNHGCATGRISDGLLEHARDFACSVRHVLGAIYERNDDVSKS